MENHGYYPIFKIWKKRLPVWLYETEEFRCKIKALGCYTDHTAKPSSMTCQKKLVLSSGILTVCFVAPVPILKGHKLTGVFCTKLAQVSWNKYIMKRWNNRLYHPQFHHGWFQPSIDMAFTTCLHGCVAGTPAGLEHNRNHGKTGKWSTREYTRFISKHKYIYIIYIIIYIYNII